MQRGKNKQTSYRRQTALQRYKLGKNTSAKSVHLTSLSYGIDVDK